MKLSFFLKPWLAKRSRTITKKRPPRITFARPFLEPLEDRILLDAGLPAAIVVGRTLSSYFVGGIQNNQETITFTVYNEAADPETGVLLTDTLAAGVTFANPSQLPDQSGQHLAWSLGTIQGYDRASVTLTLDLPSIIPLQLDTGAQAFATLDAGLVSSSTPAATLRTGNVSDPSLLASTPDANTTDPFIQEEAAELNYDPQQIFNFLENDIGYNSYLGSVRGARGTLWSSAGNALDVASLGVALMRASGIPAQYVSGTLSQSQAQQLILSMFPASYQTVGYIPADTQSSDPANDPQLLAETESHYWFQFDAGSGMEDADPLMAAVTSGGQVGQAFTANTGTFAEVPDALRETTEISLTAELYYPGFSTITGVLGELNGASGIVGTTQTVVLDQTFYDVDLVGRPLSLGNIVTQTSIATLPGITTNTYSPYIEVGDDAFPSSHDEVITGQNYQEIFSGLTVGSQILTGLFLNITLSGPQGPSETFERTIVDRIGYAARQGLVNASISIPPGDAPALTSFDVFTLDVSAAAPDPHPTAELNEELQTDATELGGLQNTPAGAQIATTYATDYDIDMTRILGNNFLTLSQVQTTTLARTSDVVAYFDRPRIVLTSQQVVESDSSTMSAGLTTAIDLVSDAPRVETAPGQAVAAIFMFNLGCGMFENVNERDTVAALVPSGHTLAVDNTYDVFNAATAQGIGLIDITSANLNVLDGLNIPEDARARITTDVLNGFGVIVPNQSVILNGVPTIAWAEINLATGQYIGVDADGGHEGALEYAADLQNYVKILSDVKAFFTPVAAFDAAGILSAAYELNRIALGNQTADHELEAGKEQVKALWEGLGNDLDVISKEPPGDLTPSEGNLQQVLDLAKKALGDSFDQLLTAFVYFFTGNNDPGVTPIVLNPLPLTALPANQASGSNGETSSLTTGSVQGTAQTASFSVLNQIAATWSSTVASELQATSLIAQGATIVSSTGHTVGTGAVTLTTVNLVPVAVSGIDSYSANGIGSLSFYGPAESSLGVCGDWESYSATVAGKVSITLTTDGLTLNGQALPAGTYTITTNSATLSGSGQTTSPNFSGSVSITATNGTINLGPSNEDLAVGGNSLGLTNGATLTDYTGSIIVAAGGGNNTDAVTFHGNAANVLTVSATPATLTTDQNTPVTFQTNVNTSFADTYNLTAQAPAGWTVTIGSTGMVTATPAPGLQGGTYPIQVIVQSTTNPDLVAQTTVNVTIAPTSPGINFRVTSDPVLTVPFDGAELPTAFQASVQNLGPSADSYNLTFANVPAGFTLLNSGTSVTVLAGQTGILGLYLQPNAGQPIPPVGTVLSFQVTATSTTNPAITETVTVNVTMPQIDALTVTSDPVEVSTTPGAGVTDAITITNVGNVTESNISLTSTLPSGLSLTGLYTLTLGAGGSATEYVTLTPSAATPLGGTLQATITATYGPVGSPLTLTLPITVTVEVPGATAIANAAVSAGQLGNANLANRLEELSTDLTNLVQNTASAIYNSQVLADIDAVSAFLGNDPYLTSFLSALSTARSELAAAVTAADYQKAFTDLANALSGLASVLNDETAHGFTFTLSPNSAVALPNSPADFGVELQNTGNQPTTYYLDVTGLYGSVAAEFMQNGQQIESVTLQPGQALIGGTDAINLQATETGGSLFPTGFTVTVTAEGAAEITQSAQGTLTVRPTFIAVTEVEANPPFTDPGSPVDVTADVLNAVNQQQQAQAYYTVTDPNGNVVFTSTPVALTLTVQTSLATVDLGSFPTTGLVEGSYTINVTVTDTLGNPIPGGTGQGSVLVGTPVTATLSVSPTTLPAGTGTVTNTLTVNSQISFPDPLTLDGQVQTTPTSTTISLYQNGAQSLAYVAGTNGIDIVDVTNPASPQLLSTFGQSEIVQGGFTVVREDNIGGTNYLIVGTTTDLNANQTTLLIYSLASPLSPTLVNGPSGTPFDYVFMSDMLVQGNTLLVPTNGVSYLFGTEIVDQFGSVLSIDVSTPAAPTLDDVLFNEGSPPSTGTTNQNGGVLVNSQIAYIASTTSTGGATQSGVGRVLVVNYSDPTNLTVTNEVDIPGTVQVLDVAIQGNRALVVGSTGGRRNFFDPGTYGLTGNLTLSVLDITNPASPQLIGTTLVTNGTFPEGSPGGPPSKISVLPLGNGQFAVSEAIVNGNPVLLLVDPTDPNKIVVTTDQVPALVNEMAVQNGELYTTSSAGLIIYNIGAIESIPYTASIEIPNGTGVSVVPGSFNIPPTQIVDGTDFDTLEWTQTLAFGESLPSFTWQSTVSNLEAGEALPVTLGGTVDFTSEGTPGTISLPPTVVSGVQVLGLSPASQTVAPAASAVYTVTVTNPRSLEDTFYLSVVGVPASWVKLPFSVTVAANSSEQVTLTLTSDPFAAVGDYGFTVTSEDDYATEDSVHGDLILAGTPTIDPAAHGVVLTLTPAQATAGQGTAASYVVQLTNTGSADDTFMLATAGLPAGITAAFSQASLDVPPGVSNFRDVILILTPAPGTKTGSYPFQVIATSTTKSSVTASAEGNLSVASQGVQLSLTPSTGAPGSTFNLKVTNTGSAKDTFDLSLGGPESLVSTLKTTKVTLAAGASTVVTIRTKAISFAIPGALSLVAMAQSVSNKAVQASATASIQVPAIQAMTAQLSPSVQVIPLPGTSNFLVVVNNIGNIEDAYTATITGTSGPVTAQLMGLDGSLTDTIPIFRLPGLATGELLLVTNLKTRGVGTVTVQITSLTNAKITATVKATISSSSSFGRQCTCLPCP